VVVADGQMIGDRAVNASGREGAGLEQAADPVAADIAVGIRIRFDADGTTVAAERGGNAGNGVVELIDGTNGVDTHGSRVDTDAGAAGIEYQVVPHRGAVALDIDRLEGITVETVVFDQMSAAASEKGHSVIEPADIAMAHGGVEASLGGNALGRCACPG